MEGLASQARPARIRIIIDAMIKSSTCAQCHAIQAHSLQIILLGSIAHEPNVTSGPLTNRVPTGIILKTLSFFLYHCVQICIFFLK